VEIILLLCGLFSVFMLGIFMSTHLHGLEEGGRRVPGGHEKDKDYDIAILQDYLKAREKLQTILGPHRPHGGPGGESLSDLVDEVRGGVMVTKPWY